MKIGIVGSSGYIGGYLLSHYRGKDYVGRLASIDMDDCAEHHLNLEHPEMFDYSELDGLDYIIFTAAISYRAGRMC